MQVGKGAWEDKILFVIIVYFFLYSPVSSHCKKKLWKVNFITATFRQDVVLGSLLATGHVRHL